MRIVIIGAGIVGASAAWHAARAGATITVIDAALAGRATAAGAGIICPWVASLDDTSFYQLYASGGEYYPAFADGLAEDGETDLGYRRVGAMLVSDDEQELAGTERFVRSRQTISPTLGTVSRLTAAEAQALFPPLHPKLAAVHVSGGARVDGRRLTASLLRAAARHGGDLITAEAVPWIEHGHSRGVQLDDRRIEADRVLVTTGAWADKMLRSMSGGLTVQPQRGQIVHLCLENTETEHWPVILPPGAHYLVPFDGGRVVVGATRESGVGFDYRVTAAGQAEVLSEALRIAPGLGTATLLETRVGFRPASGSGRPVLGWMPGIEALAVGNGMGAAGLTLGPFAGRLLADLLLGRPCLLDEGAFSPGQTDAATVSGVLR